MADWKALDEIHGRDAGFNKPRKVAPSSEPSIPAESGITGYCIDNYHECCDVPCGCHCHKIKALEDRIAELERLATWFDANTGIWKGSEVAGMIRAALAAPSGVKP